MPCGLQVRRGSRVFVQTFSFLHCLINISLIVCFLTDGAGRQTLRIGQSRCSWTLGPKAAFSQPWIGDVDSNGGLFNWFQRHAAQRALGRTAAMAGAISAADVCASSRRLRAARVEPQLLVLPWLPSAREGAPCSCES